MAFTYTSLPLNLYTSVFGCGCGFGSEQKFWRIAGIDGFGEEKARICGFACPYSPPPYLFRVLLNGFSRKRETARSLRRRELLGIMTWHIDFLDSRCNVLTIKRWKRLQPLRPGPERLSTRLIQEWQGSSIGSAAGTNLYCGTPGWKRNTYCQCEVSSVFAKSVLSTIRKNSQAELSESGSGWKKGGAVPIGSRLAYTANFFPSSPRARFTVLSEQITEKTVRIQNLDLSAQSPTHKPYFFFLLPPPLLSHVRSDWQKWPRFQHSTS